MKPLIYLDNSATTKVRPEVVEAMLPFLTDLWGNASSIHSAGRHARAAVEQAREYVAIMLGAQPSEVIFTPNATYSNNAAILGRARFVEQHGMGKHIITTAIEHSSAIEPARHLKSRGWRVTALSANREGLIDIEQLRSAIAADTSIISVMWANNEVGTIQPVHAIAELAAEKGIFFHTDAVQAAGKICIDLSTTSIQSLSLSGHKFHAPKGIGIHYVRKGTEILPLNFGGGQEGGRVSGTENVANIVALGKAAELADRQLDTNAKRLRDLANILAEKLLCLPQVKLTGASLAALRVPGHLSIMVKGRTGKDIVEAADLQGICIASSSACSSGKNSLSHVLSSMGLCDAGFGGAVRISAGIFNTEEECSNAADVLAQIVNGSSERLIA